jgi:hypothetical protein
MKSVYSRKSSIACRISHIEHRRESFLILNFSFLNCFTPPPPTSQVAETQLVAAIFSPKSLLRKGYRTEPATRPLVTCTYSIAIPPKPLFSYPKPLFSYPESSFSYPKPSVNYPKPSYSYPKPSYSYPKPLFIYPESSFSYPKPSFSYPKPSVNYPKHLYYL